MELDEIKISITKDKKDNFAYIIMSKNDNSITACYTGNEALEYIKELFIRAILK